MLKIEFGDTSIKNKNKNKNGDTLQKPLSFDRWGFNVS
jgi:hypothetical protein